MAIVTEGRSRYERLRKTGLRCSAGTVERVGRQRWTNEAFARQSGGTSQVDASGAQRRIRRRGPRLAVPIVGRGSEAKTDSRNDGITVRARSSCWIDSELVTVVAGRDGVADDADVLGARARAREPAAAHRHLVLRRCVRRHVGGRDPRRVRPRRRSPPRARRQARRRGSRSSTSSPRLHLVCGRPLRAGRRPGEGPRRWSTRSASSPRRPAIAIVGAGAALANPGGFIPIALKTISETDPCTAQYASTGCSSPSSRCCRWRSRWSRRRRARLDGADPLTSRDWLERSVQDEGCCDSSGSPKQLWMHLAHS